jgi:hypothetical protein
LEQRAEHARGLRNPGPFAIGNLGVEQRQLPLRERRRCSVRVGTRLR